MPPNLVLSIESLRYRWPGDAQDTLAIDALSLERGESLFLYGPSGSGKSTLIATIAGTVEIAPKVVSVAGTDLAALRGGAKDRFRGNHIGLIFQVFNLVPWLSALENVLLACEHAPMRRERLVKNARQEALDLLNALGLEQALVERSAGDLSIGQQQRVAAARALIGSPELVLADEATSALDAETRDRFVDLLITHCAKIGTALLFVSHDRALEPRFSRSLDFSALNRVAEHT